ncbi:MAG TPA: hypothetical protein VF833_04150 [Gaiellaceae bacterium]
MALLGLFLVVSCGSAPAVKTPAPVNDLVIPTTVPNGKVEVIVKATYAVGEPIRATIRLSPASGTLRGPLDTFIQASGFHGTATVRHLGVDPISVSAGAAEVVVLWDMRDDAGAVVGSDDYSLVFNVIDDAGRTTTVGTTLQVR